MSSEQNDEFLPDDELMEELPEEGFVPEEEGTELDDSEGLEAGEEAVPEFASENSGEETEEGAVEEEDKIPENEKTIEYRPPRMDLYTMLLLLSLIFVSLAATIHWLEVPPSEYGNSPWKKNSPLVTAPKTP